MVGVPLAAAPGAVLRGVENQLQCLDPSFGDSEEFREADGAPRHFGVVKGGCLAIRVQLLDHGESAHGFSEAESSFDEPLGAYASSGDRALEIEIRSED